MVSRIIELTSNSSFFLFGARGTGKTHLLKERYNHSNNWYIDLLDPDISKRFLLHPESLITELNAKKTSPEWIIIDEVQKSPVLLDIVHQLIESRKQKFILSGSSARKLKRGAANLLAGRAFVYHLFPLTAKELGSDFDLEQALNWGTLPKLLDYDLEADKKMYLKAYANTYIKEEILQEQIIRKLEPFQRFLPIAAQMSGRIINYSKIAQDVGSSIPTVQSYFQILEDTLLGAMLPHFNESIRKRQKVSPKFYFIDAGIQRALLDELTLSVKPQTYLYGMAFEQFIINEIIRLQVYYQKDYRLSYLLTGAGVEIDLIIERPGMPRVAIEIKSKTTVSESDLTSLISLGKDIPNIELFCFSLDKSNKLINGVRCLYWIDGLMEIGL